MERPGLQELDGLPWLQVLIAWGSVPLEVVALYNDRIREKIAEERDDYVTADPPSASALAAAQGRAPPPARDIQHKTAQAKALRQRAKYLMRFGRRADLEWEQALWRRSSDDYTALAKDASDPSRPKLKMRFPAAQAW